MPESNNQYHHLFPSNTSTTEQFTSPKSGRKTFNLPPRNRSEHKDKLLRQMQEIKQDAVLLSKQRKTLGITAEDGIIITFNSDTNCDLKFESLEYSPSGIELLTVKKENEITTASVFVPEGKIKYFINKIEKYGTEDTAKGKPKNKDLIEGISEIRKATLQALWNDEPELFPEPGEIIWWEIWLRIGKNREEVFSCFL